VYGGRLLLPKGASSELIDAIRGFKRQALHAARLAFEHPATGKPVDVTAPIPEDMQSLLGALAKDSKLAVAKTR
jgi:23S rRNA pseudouridine1911/1915/1917 synthase